MGKKTAHMNDFLVKRTGQTEHVSARVQKTIYDVADKIRKKNNHSWSSIVQAGVKLYVTENGVDLDEII